MKREVSKCYYSPKIRTNPCVWNYRTQNFFFKAIGTEIIKLSQFIGQLITSLKQINAAKKLIEASGEKAPPSIYLFIPLVLLAANDAGINSEQTDELLRRTNLVLVLDQLAESGKLLDQELTKLVKLNWIFANHYRYLDEQEQNSVREIVGAMNLEYQLTKIFQKTRERFKQKEEVLSSLSSTEDNLAEEYFKISTKSNAANWVTFSLEEEKNQEVTALVNLVNQATRLCLDLATVNKDLVAFAPNVVIIEMIDTGCTLSTAKARITNKLVDLSQKITRLEEKLKHDRIIQFASSLYRWTEYLTLRSLLTKFVFQNLGWQDKE